MLPAAKQLWICFPFGFRSGHFLASRLAKSMFVDMTNPCLFRQYDVTQNAPNVLEGSADMSIKKWQSHVEIFGNSSKL